MGKVGCIKRNTTAMLPIRVDGVNYTNVKRVKIVFKGCKHNSAPPSLIKEYSFGNDVFTETSSMGFKLNIKLDPSDTFKFTPGDLFVDVYPITNIGIINTGEPLRYDVIDTLLKEVIS